MPNNRDRAREKKEPWQFCLRSVLLIVSILSFCLALAAQGQLATMIFLLSMPLWCWTCIQMAIGCAAVLMPSQPDKSKRWRPRFSLRTLMLVSVALGLLLPWGARQYRDWRLVNLQSQLKEAKLWRDQAQIAWNIANDQKSATTSSASIAREQAARAEYFRHQNTIRRVCAKLDKIPGAVNPWTRR